MGYVDPKFGMHVFLLYSWPSNDSVAAHKPSNDCDALNLKPPKKPEQHLLVIGVTDKWLFPQNRGTPFIPKPQAPSPKPQALKPKA